MHVDGVEIQQPNLFKACMKRISQVMDQRNQHRFLFVGKMSFDPDEDSVYIDLEKVHAYLSRPPEK